MENHKDEEEHVPTLSNESKDKDVASIFIKYKGNFSEQTSFEEKSTMRSSKKTPKDGLNSVAQEDFILCPLLKAALKQVIEMPSKS